MKSIITFRNAVLSALAVLLICSCTSVRHNYTYPTLSDNYHKKTGLSHNRHVRHNQNNNTAAEKVSAERNSNENSLVFSRISKDDAPVTVKGFGIKEVNTSVNAGEKLENRTRFQQIVLGLPVVRLIKPSPIAAVPAQHGVAGTVNKGWEKIIKVTGNKHLSAAMIPERGRSSGAGMGIASFVCGIVGLLFAGIILGILAIIFGMFGLSRPMHGLAIAGIVLGIIDVIGAIVFISTM